MGKIKKTQKQRNAKKTIPAEASARGCDGSGCRAMRTKPKDATRAPAIKAKSNSILLGNFLKKARKRTTENVTDSATPQLINLRKERNSNDQNARIERTASDAAARAQAISRLNRMDLLKGGID